MTENGTTIAAETPNGASFAIPEALRQPADALGPRAQRTIQRIMEATREVFLTRGYTGTTIDEIARVADVSRASFYTYFPSKRDVLIAVGERSASENERMIGTLPDHLTSRAALRVWVAEYFELLEVHGSFAFAWTQAAQEDEEIRLAGMRRHYGQCKKAGTVLLASTGRTSPDAGPLGLLVLSVLERTWNYSHLYAEVVDRAVLITQTANAIWGIARQPVS
jgi:AcrR family transcriptional regulator